MSKPIGKFITVEGCEGVGKSTQCRLLKEYCVNNGIDAVFTREPGGTALAEKIRAILSDAKNEGIDPVTELLLYGAARRENVKKIIEPALREGKIVFCDRFTVSTAAYQGFGRGIGAEIIETLNGIAADGTEIYLTVFLDAPPAVGFKRKGGADKSERVEREDEAFFGRVYAGFKRQEERHPERFISVGTSGTKYETHAKIVELLKNKKVF